MDIGGKRRCQCSVTASSQIVVLTLSGCSIALDVFALPSKDPAERRLQ